ncbi:MAG: ATP-binding cassette domain-containing protein, partial [Desulfobulbia bacterium]
MQPADSVEWTREGLVLLRRGREWWRQGPGMGYSGLMIQAPSKISISDDPNGQAVVSVTGLTKRFGERLVVDNISFAIRRGQCVGFLGPNGAGKTTCINMLLGLVEKSAGEIRIFGLEAPRFHREIKARIGVVPQADSLDPDLSVEENLRTYAGYFRIPRRLARARVEEL